MLDEITVVLPSVSVDEPDFTVIEPYLKKAKQVIAPTALDYFNVGAQANLAIAAITGKADGLETQTGYWLRADPVELRTDINSAYFFGAGSIELSLSQAQAIGAGLAPLFNDYGAKLQVASAYRWYLALAEPVGIQSAAPLAMMGQSVRDYLQEVDVSWRKLFTEIQMALQLCPVNRQLPTPITALWFWGEGQLPTLQQTGWQKIIANDVLSQGLADRLNIPYLPLTETVLHNFAALDKSLIVFEKIDKQVEKLLSSCYQCLRKGHLQTLNLYLSGQAYYQISAKNLPAWWQFWRK